MVNSMTEPQLSTEQISLYAQLEAIQAAMEMHIKRSEALALQASRLVKELEDENPE